MVAVSKPPVSLTDPEILAVIAYLQSLGGTVSVTMQTKLKYAGQSAPLLASSKPATAPTSVDDKKGMELVTKHACVTCHNLTDPAKLVGPSLYDVGRRLSRAEIYESIMEPDAVITPGFDEGLMQATLDGVQFYGKVTATELKTLVDFLASRKGKE
jgi:cytochrome c551/c552